MSKAKELIEQLSQYVEPAHKARVTEEESDKTPGDEVEDLEIKVVEEDKDQFHEMLNTFCNQFDPQNAMSIKECVNTAYEQAPRDVDKFIDKLLELQYTEQE